MFGDGAHLGCVGQRHLGLFRFWSTPSRQCERPYTLGLQLERVRDERGYDAHLKGVRQRERQADGSRLVVDVGHHLQRMFQNSLLRFKHLAWSSLPAPASARATRAWWRMQDAGPVRFESDVVFISCVMVVAPQQVQVAQYSAVDPDDCAPRRSRR